MTMVHTHTAFGAARPRPAPEIWLHRVADRVSELYANWSRARTLRALEALPPETLKDIGWPTTDNHSTRIVRK